MSNKSIYSSITEPTSHQKKMMQPYTSDWDDALEECVLSQWLDDWDDWDD